MSIADNLHIALFDDVEGEKIIRVGKNVHCTYFSFFSKESSFLTHIICEGEGAQVSINSLIFSLENTIRTKIVSQLSADNVAMNMNILSFAGKGGNVKIDGILQVDTGTKGCI